MKWIAPAVLALLIVSSAMAAFEPPAPAGVIEGRGAAGAVEAGRSLDLLRSRAEREARERAVASLVLASRSHQPAADPARLEGRVRSLASGDIARWYMDYWSNGAVSARVTLPASSLEPE